MKKHEFFKEMKKEVTKKEKPVKPMKLAKDALVLVGGVAILAGGMHLLGEALD